MVADAGNLTLGWVGTGRMGYALCERLLAGGCDLSVWNRTRAKAEPLALLGATVVDRPSELADRDIVFTMVSGPEDVLAVTTGPDGVLTDPDARPGLLVDSSTIDPDTSALLREQAAALGVPVLAAPVSGNPAVVASGRLSTVASGPRDAFDTARPYLDMYGSAATWAGPGEEARWVKIAHNLMLGVVTQMMAETTLLLEKAGVERSDWLEFLNRSVMGSTFTGYKTPALVNLDWSPTFTMHLLKKDFELGLGQGRDLGVPLPVSALVHQLVTEAIGRGFGDLDFAALLAMGADAAGMALASDDRRVADGLSD